MNKNISSRWIVPLACVAIALCVLRGYDSNTGFTHLIEFGDEWNGKRLAAVEQTHPHVRSHCFGYDGQFFAQIAVVPTLRSEELKNGLDNPPYRCHRIFLPLLAYCLGMGKVAWILQAYALLNLVFWGILFWLLLRQVRGRDLFSWGCVLVGVMFSTGALESIRRALTDLPSATLGLGMVMLILAGRYGKGYVVFLLTLLTKNTMLLSGLVCLHPFRWKEKKYWGRVLLVLIPLGIWGAWCLYVKSVFPDGGVVDANSKQFGLPLYSMVVAAFRTIPQASIANRFDYFFVIPAIIALGTQSVYLIRKWRWSDPVWLYGLPFAALFWFLGEGVWGEPRACFRILLPMTIAFHVLLACGDERRKWWWFILANLHFPYAVINILTYRI